MVIPFSEAISLSGEKPRSLMLGNGFSIEASDLFRYGNLYDRAKIDQPIKSMFERLGTCDFEIVISELDHTRDVLQIYDPESQELISSLGGDAEGLRNIFSKSIIQHHVTHQVIFNVMEGHTLRRRTCRKFLSHFSKIFTTNYDLLLYWEIMNEREHNADDGIFPMDDGFGYMDSNLIWLEPYKSSGREQNIFYLHGSLFFSGKSYGLVKEMQDINSLLDEIRKNIVNQNQLPLIVLEGSHESKYKKICNHLYLKNSYDELGALSGNLFIFGHSLKLFDEHILKAIRSSNIKDIFVSKHNQDTDVEFQGRAELLRRDASGKEVRHVHLYDAESASAWA